MDCPAVISVLRALFDRGICTPPETDVFTERKHAELVETLVTYLNSHRHFLGICQIEHTQALNDRGVDVLLVVGGVKVGFQIKSHFDVQEKGFAANTKRQLAESMGYGLDCYFVLICSPLRDSKKDYTEKITHLLNDLRVIADGVFLKGIHCFRIGPRATATIFRNPATVSRDEMLRKKAVSDACLNDYEQGFEHLPELHDPDVDAAFGQFYANYGEEWWDTEGKEANHAYGKVIELWERKTAERFTNQFLPTMPLPIQQQRRELTTEIQNTLAELRECATCDEDRWPPWLEYVEEAMIPYTSLPNLFKIRENVTELLSRFRCVESEARPRILTCHEECLGFSEPCDNRFDSL